MKLMNTVSRFYIGCSCVLYTHYTHTRYMFLTLTVGVCVGHLLFHKVGANTVVFFSIMSCVTAYNDTVIVYRVPYRGYRDTSVSVRP